MPHEEMLFTVSATHSVSYLHGDIQNSTLARHRNHPFKDFFSTRFPWDSGCIILSKLLSLAVMITILVP